jgi:HEAT repeat protein
MIGITLVMSLVTGIEPTPASVRLSGPYNQQVTINLARLSSERPPVRLAGVEAVGLLRAYGAETELIARLRDADREVRRQAALALGWCGGRQAIPPLLASLEDADWLTRQAAHVALLNLTGMEFPFDGSAGPEHRAGQVQRWRDWWATVPAEAPPPEVLELLVGPHNLALGRQVTASSTYKGPPHVLTDGQFGPEYWQTKNVPLPQWCTVDLGRPVDIAQVVVHQYSRGYCMTEYELAVSLDNKQFRVVRRERGTTPVELVISFPPQRARFVRITSLGAEKSLYPTTFLEIEIYGPGRETIPPQESIAWRQDRGLRALGALGGRGATAAILNVLGPSPPTSPASRPLVRAGIRALGRLREEAGFTALVRWLDNLMWARAAADALGDFGDRRAVSALLRAYPRYARQLDGRDPVAVPADDQMGFPSEDRMLETPYWIAYALCRLPLDDPNDRRALEALAPLFAANLPNDHDTFILFQPEAGGLLLRHLLEKSGRRAEACQHAFRLIGPSPQGKATSVGLPGWSIFPPYRLAAWLPVLCDAEDTPQLLRLLEHPDRFVRINAAKALARLGDRRAVATIARLLERASAEADYGYSGQFKDEEYDDPAPRWRIGLVRALGLLGAHEQTGLLVRILNDERSVLEVRHAAAEALGDLGSPTALTALRQAARTHSFRSIQHIARDALRARGETEEEESPTRSRSVPSPRTPVAQNQLASFDALLFIKGDNDVPNTKYTVEQADRWRQTYVVTDEGPAYRPGNNLYLLRPPRPDGRVTPLTRFTEGYVANPEVSWDGTKVLFTHRDQANPWWHIYRIGVDGTGLKQLTEGPYHDVTPAWLPDGRIVFASSRLGIRDEYHGYPCTGLYVMNQDGSDIHPIATNIGRDNEPALLPDGRIVFSRLEVFYSRNKTELTLHAVHPDGTSDMVRYGPERRAFWRNLDHGPPDPADLQEAPLTHRVLRMTQPRPMPDGRHIVVSTQGGLTLVGPRRDTETLLTQDYRTRAYTTPFPLPDGRILCASTLKTPDRTKVDLGLYLFDPALQKLELIYNDPATADYEPRPIMARPVPPVLPEMARRDGYSGQFFCSSVFASQEQEVRERGRLVRLIEGIPVVQRNSTHRGPWEVWKNHGGTLARILGTAPLAPDGSFLADVPADRLLHLQVLDSDRRVVGNQLTWISPRPGEIRSCVGCHEPLHTTARAGTGLAAGYAPLRFLPRGQEFQYRAKAWFKGSLPMEIEERTRTVHAVNLLAR